MPTNRSTKDGLEVSLPWLTQLEVYKSIAISPVPEYVKTHSEPMLNLPLLQMASTWSRWTVLSSNSKNRGIGGKLKEESSTFGECLIITTLAEVGFGHRQLQLVIASSLRQIQFPRIDFDRFQDDQIYSFSPKFTQILYPLIAAINHPSFFSKSYFKNNFALYWNRVFDFF